MLPAPAMNPMKTRILLALAALTLSSRGAETLSTDTAVFSAADPKSAVIARLKAGAAITPAEGEAPSGWRLVAIAGPFDGFVHNRDINKGLEVREGASIHLAPKADAPVLTVVAPGDKSEVVGLAANGDWCQIKLDKTLTGYVATGRTANSPAATIAPAVTSPASTVATPSSPGHPVVTQGNTTDLPRTFAGTLTAAARPILNPNPPYDYHLVDASGKRLAYVDLKKITLNARIDTILNRPVTITGTIRNTVDGKDLVIAAESIQPR